MKAGTGLGSSVYFRTETRRDERYQTLDDEDRHLGTRHKLEQVRLALIQITGTNALYHGPVVYTQCSAPGI